MKVTLAESAVTDLAEILDYYRERDAEDAGRRIVGEILDGIERLADHPDSGRIVPEFEAPFLRELILPPFRVVYRRDPDRVRVVRVWRSERLLRLDD